MSLLQGEEIINFKSAEESGADSLYGYNYTQLNSTMCSIKLAFKSQVSDPALGKADMLSIVLRSAFIFISAEHKMPLDDTKLEHAIPLQKF